jgi:two-component system, OmpR family, response regulator
VQLGKLPFAIELHQRFQEVKIERLQRELHPSATGWMTVFGDDLTTLVRRLGVAGAYLMAQIEIMRLLVVEDDKKLASYIVKGFREVGFAVDHCVDGEEGLVMATGSDYDAAIVDIMLPRLNGLRLVEELRKQRSFVPVLILSAKASVDDRVKGLQTGGDDYLPKPFAFAELLARVQALVRRGSRETEPSTLSVGDLRLDLLSRKVTRAGKKIELQAREFALLEYLMRNAGRVVTKTMILDHVWDYSFDPQTNVVDVLVCRVRNKVDKDFEPKLIRTVRGMGYVLEAA